MKDGGRSLVQLSTKYQEQLGNEIAFTEYPRPQLKRQSYFCLNGWWRFTVLKKDGEARYNGKIRVPFVPESVISGVNIDIDKDHSLVYERTFSLPHKFSKDKVILHVGACDQYALVQINGKTVGENVGVLPFSFDVTKYLISGENSIKITAKDPLNKDIPYGKQTNKRGGMWYTKISGIWQTVWMESVPNNYVKDIRITPDLNGVNVKVIGGEKEKKIVLDGKEYCFIGDSVRIDVENPILWTPENPHLYEFTLYSGKDQIQSYFGLRTISIVKHNDMPCLALNDKPYFFHGLLDQGYFSDGIYLPSTPKGFLDDVLTAKKCGFNTLRKHIKLEPDLFYYYCDKCGMIVFQDMINSGRYSFIIDTALPTVFLKRGISHGANKFRRKTFRETCKGVIDKLYNHPSVVYYTIFNEGWGQFDEKKNYQYLKSLDDTRIYDTTSGWFKKSCTDVESDHVYFKKVKVRKVKKKPWVLSEFGGYSLKVDGHVFNLDNEYGYKKFSDVESFENALVALYQNQIIPAVKKGLSASIYTQVSDIEDEINGLLTYDRKVLKVNEERLKKLSEELYAAIEAR